jgi:hypothetical protein
MPMPVSVTDTSAKRSCNRAPTPIRPPSGVNFKALDRRFREYLLHLPFVAPDHAEPWVGGAPQPDPRRLARSRTRISAFSMACGRSNSATSNSIAVQEETLTITTHHDFKNTFAAASTSHAEAIVILSSPLVSQYGELLANLSVAHRLPTVSMFRENVTAGCLMAYGPSLVDGWRRLASFVSRVLKGAKPGDFPIERPTTFELVINLKTAKALGLTIPPSLLGRADEIIQ